MFRSSRSITLILLFLALPLMPIRAQGTGPIQESYLVWMPSSNAAASQTFARVTFANSLSKAPSRAQITITTRPSGTRIGVNAATLLPGNDKVLVISLDPAVPPLADDTQAEVRFDQLPLSVDPITTPVTSTGEIYNRSNIKSLADLRLKEAEEAVAHSKTKEERNIFAGFSATAPSDGDAEGNADISLNHQWQVPSLFASLSLKKSTADEADPKYFSLALGYRKIFSSQAGRLRNIRNLVAAAENQARRDPDDSAAAQKNGQAISTEINNLSKGFLLNFIIDAAGRLEGEAMNLNVTNAIFDMPLQLASRTRRIGGDAFWNFRIVPAGVELGRNLHSENEVMEKYYIGRFKFGGELNFYYEARDQENAFPRRIELTLQAVDRYLWRDETAFDQETMKAIGISKGHKSWFQGDLNIFLGATKQGRFGFKVSRIRGKLPPTFADTKAYTFGLVFQSADDNSNQ